MGHHPETVFITFLLSFEKVKQKSHAAAELLHFCAFLHPDSIPETLITSGLKHFESDLQEVIGDPLSLNKIIGVLGSYSLIRRKNQTLWVHRLVQAVIKDDISVIKKQQLAKQAVQVVNTVFPHVNYGTWLKAQPFLPHAENCVLLIQEYGFKSAEAASLLWSYGLYFYYRGQYKQSKSLLQKALYISENNFGPGFPQTGVILRDIGQNNWREGKYKEAKSFYEQSLQRLEQMADSQPLELAFTQHTLARLLGEQGIYDKSEQLFQKALTVLKQNLGLDHTMTGRTMHEFAYMLRQKGVFTEAEQLAQQAWNIFKQTQGIDHPSTASILRTLVRIQIEQGTTEEAEKHFKHILAIFVQELGPQHLETGTTLYELASLYQKQDKYGDAEPLYQQALHIFNQIGPQHPQSASTLYELALLYQKQQKYEQAQMLYQQTLEIQKIHLGFEHINTQKTQKAYDSLLQIIQCNKVAKISQKGT